MRLRDAEILDLRFPTSEGRHGSDAMNPDPDYSAAYVILNTENAGGLAGHGLAFTIGRGNKVVCAAIRALLPRARFRAPGDHRRHGRVLASFAG